MKWMSKLVALYGELHKLSKMSIGLGLALMVVFYIIAWAANLLAPTATDYLYARAIYYGALECAPACLAVGICAGLIGDAMLASRKK